MIDTGATVSCVEPRIIEALALTPIGEREYFMGAGKHLTETYSMSLVLGDAKAVPDMVPHTRLLQAVVQPHLHEDFDMSIGVDALERCVLTYDRRAGTGTIEFD